MKHIALALSLSAFASLSVAQTAAPKNATLAEAIAELRRDAQHALIAKGYKPGRPSGELTPETQAALRKYQKDQAIKEPDALGPKTIASLGLVFPKFCFWVRDGARYQLLCPKGCDSYLEFSLQSSGAQPQGYTVTCPGTDSQFWPIPVN